MRFFFALNIMTAQNIYQLYKKTGIISTDSRESTQGGVFFALKGDNFDGNGFASKALENGCDYAVIDNPANKKSEKYILVDDVLKTLQEVAVVHRNNLNIPIIGITGSNGKTTTKELMAAVLSMKFRTGSTRGNLNNHIGVPITILSLPKETQIAVIEMGANHQGEIARLCEIAKPNYGIITNIGKAHLEGFGGPDGVKKAKAELYQYLSKTNGTAFVNSGDDTLVSLINKTGCNFISYGTSPDDFCLGIDMGSNPFVNISLVDKSCSLASPSRKEIHSNLFGNYNFSNILAAVCTGMHFGIEFSQIKQAIESYFPSNNRSQVVETEKNTLILDNYNANPTSMKIALDSFFSLDDERKVVILGDMLELGKYAEKEHERIINKIINYKNLFRVFLIGPLFNKTCKNEDITCFDTVTELIAHLKKNPLTETSVLVKGSRKIQLEKVIAML